MYLSRVELDITNRQKTKDLTHVGAYHHWVEQSFPEEANIQRTRKLWRMDYLNCKHYLLVVSAQPPCADKLEKYGVVGSAKVKNYDEFLYQLRNGMRARFRVTLNPVVSRSQGADKRGRVMPHVTAEQQSQFLVDRASKNGFETGDKQFNIVERDYVQLKKSGHKTIRLSKVSYEGVLRITDAEVFVKTLTQGFGKKKAYGFGMMTVIPIVL